MGRIHTPRGTSAAGCESARQSPAGLLRARLRPAQAASSGRGVRLVLGDTGDGGGHQRHEVQPHTEAEQQHRTENPADVRTVSACQASPIAASAEHQEHERLRAQHRQEPLRETRAERDHDRHGQEGEPASIGLKPSTFCAKA